MIAASKRTAAMVVQRDQREESIAGHRPSSARSADRFRGMYVRFESPSDTTRIPGAHQGTYREQRPRGRKSLADGHRSNESDSR
ncbi:hypothetical protein LP52_06885 [Streptomonospora alba]|uniref:Uncharacterized protein n=1 Tax=Streptomonospora alba TaxID=183763 RepID=A0A0C2G8C8_9ACTN|nr:hypothetical protein LP52_06885 [Streptomonospora alba]